MLRIVCLVSILIVGIHSTVWAAGEYDRLRDTVRGLTVDSSTVRTIDGILYEHGLITITLEQGTIAYLKSVRGDRIGVVFSGTGSMSFQPNMITERTNLQRFTDAEVFTADFTEATFLTTDTSLTSLIDPFEKGGEVVELSKIAAGQWSSLAMGGPETEMDDILARTLLNDFTINLFMGRFTAEDELDCYVIHDPYDVEPYRLAIVKAPGVNITSTVMVNQCPGMSGLAETSDDGVDAGDLVKTLQHTIAIDIDRSLDMIGTDRADMVVRSDSLLWIDIGLYQTLTVDSVKVSGYPALEFHRAKDAFPIWVKLPRTFVKNEKFALEVYFHGDVIERIENYPILVTSILWYPAASHRQLTFFDVTFDYPESMVLAAVGARNEFNTVNARTHARWVTGRPVRNYSFHIGFFKRMDFAAEGGAPRGVVLYRTTQQADVVLQDVKQSLLFFTKLFGVLPVDSLVATELPGNHGEAFPGLLHLSWQTFYTSDNADFFAEQFIAHEVAHQWWGIAVDFDSYRDQWLSEGFAMYSCLMYSQLAAMDNNKFFKLLENYRKEILSFGKRTIGRDLPPPAIALGHRVNAGAFQSGAYNTFVYYKGAWVLHMLRNLMLDMQTMKEDAFMTVMNTFYHNYKGKRASTEDFRKTIVDVTGVDLGWFFDQWVYGNQIPTYTYAWKKEKQVDGNWKVTLRIKQTDVPESFQMYVPVKLDLEDDTSVRYRLVMTGAEMTVDLPVVSKEPDELVFNDLSSVLCDVDEESFD